MTIRHITIARGQSALHEGGRRAVDLDRGARRGFSVIEMIFVSLNIIVLLAVLIPMIADSREAARRTRCLNNLKQIGLGLVNYETTLGALPPGVVDDQGPITQERIGRRIGWMMQLLPFIEKSPVYQAARLDHSMFDLENTTATSTSPSTLFCPSSRGSSYAACHDDAERPIDHHQNGVMFLNSHVRIEEIEDGSSNTLLVGEKLREPLQFPWWAGTRSTLRNTGSPINAKVDPQVWSDVMYVGGFASSHPGGSNFALADGSARFILETIDPVVYRRLGHRSDGELNNWDKAQTSK